MTTISSELKSAFESWAQRKYRNAEQYTRRDYQMGLDAWSEAHRALGAAPGPSENSAAPGVHDEVTRAFRVLPAELQSHPGVKFLYTAGLRATQEALAAGRSAPDAGEHATCTSPAQPQLTVWFGSMQESNGRKNWTAILCRKDQAQPAALMDGFQLSRSEFKDRVRYDADCARHMIGELAEPPDILQYDAELRD